ncbi:uncharacterized protein C8Q71DRAFT_876057 [Rhodofomes roseus]|uniref:DNA/RNA-binding domain-containing protein n=1 Tax=Rhodofomes roseus TaxID=34475 RepID=A0ABQ8KVK0_9APHY|nr:uncharacterized protein C8Q71DRAFT_876057 [Rhodofomes roseus]KAH9842320.1 hypothetical protein C8Q71DRAFT_876057 [Rhodofomes roseus]
MRADPSAAYDITRSRPATTLTDNARLPLTLTLLSLSLLLHANDAQYGTAQHSSTQNGGGSSDRAERRHPRQLLEVPSVGLAVAHAIELVPEKEHSRQIAREWYAKGLTGTPSAGKLYHHIGLLCRERDGSGEELQGLYHFEKSMITAHPYSTSREAILQIWSPAAQTCRQGPDAGVADLYIILHGMLFTHIQMDDFHGILDRFDEKLNIEVRSSRSATGIMMAVINLGAIFEDVVSARARVSPAMAASSAGKAKLMAKKAEDNDRKMDVDDKGAAPCKADWKLDAMSMSPALSEVAVALLGLK